MLFSVPESVGLISVGFGGVVGHSSSRQSGGQTSEPLESWTQ
jgi:hypothetical protein